MKKLIIAMLAMATGLSVGCSENKDTGENKPDESAWKQSECSAGETTPGCSEGKNTGENKPDEPAWKQSACSVGETTPCYTGAKETQDVGNCKSGYRECVLHAEQIGRWGTECIGEVLPSYNYYCDMDNPGLDVDCNGVPEIQQDDDGDGLTICDSYGRRLDCCDNDKMCLEIPKKFYFRFQFPRKSKRSIFKDCKGDRLDGDCNGVVDDGAEDCTEEEIQAALALTCGDGHIQNAEECDEGAVGLVDENGKRIGGTGVYGACKADCTWASYCGDGYVDTANHEVCDEGIGYEARSHIKGKGGTDTYGHCKPDCSGMSSFGYCGDGKVNGPEECDEGVVGADGKLIGGNGGYGHCKADCTWDAYCGDGKVNELDKENGEECDLGKYSNNGVYGGCMPNCKLAPHCGDKIVTSPYERCDLGTADNIGKYSANPSNIGCDSECHLPPYCGDGVVDTAYGEECDDGNKTDGDGCSSSCKKESSSSGFCGNGVIDAGEECDAGNTNWDTATCNKYCKKVKTIECPETCPDKTYCDSLSTGDLHLKPQCVESGIYDSKNTYKMGGFDKDDSGKCIESGYVYYTTTGDSGRMSYFKVPLDDMMMCFTGNFDDDNIIGCVFGETKLMSCSGQGENCGYLIRQASDGESHVISTCK